MRDGEGHVLQPEMRDDHKHSLGSRSWLKRKRGETDCGTTTIRRPDCLWVVRERKNSRIVAALSVEVDEDCHRTRSFACECGKVDDTFQSMQRIAKEEGAEEGEREREDAQCVLFQVFKFNPNACDVGSFALDDRISVLAKACSAFLTRNPEEYTSLPFEDRMVPHVTCFYYHTKATSSDGKPLLEEYAKLSPEWRWGGNLAE